MLHFIITKGHICIMYLVEIYSCIILAFSLFVHASLCTDEALFLIWSGDKCTAPNAGSLHGFDHVQDNTPAITRRDDYRLGPTSSWGETSRHQSSEGWRKTAKNRNDTFSSSCKKQ